MGKKSSSSKLVLISDQPVKYSRENGGYTLLYHLSNPRIDQAFNVVLQSSEEVNKRKLPVHAMAREFAGKRVRITVETFDE